MNVHDVEVQHPGHCTRCNSTRKSGPLGLGLDGKLSPGLLHSDRKQGPPTVSFSLSTSAMVHRK